METWIYFPILDTSEIGFEIELEKLKEETEELLGAVIKYKTNEFELIDNVIEESYDVIQVVVNIIDRLGVMDYMTEGLERHIEKLRRRGWKFKMKYKYTAYSTILYIENIKKYGYGTR